MGGKSSFSSPAGREQGADFSAACRGSQGCSQGKTSCGHSTMAILALSGASSACTMLSPVDSAIPDVK